MQNNMNIFEAADTYILAEAEVLIAAEQRKLEREEADFEAQVRKPYRTFAVDEDDLAIFVEHQLKVQAGLEWFKTNSARIKQLQERIDAAKAGDYLPKDEYSALWTELKKRLANAKDFSPRYQAAKAEVMAVLTTDPKALWARWFQMDDPAEWLAEHMAQDQGLGWDAEEFDTQEHLHQEHDGDVESETHLIEMMRGEGLAWMDESVTNESPYLGDFWDNKLQRVLENEALEAQSQIGCCPF
jgi:hypothetical protein